LYGCNDTRPKLRMRTKCAVCGTADAHQVTDHMQVGTPGTPTHDEGVCDKCGAVLDHVVDRYGGDLTMLVEDAQREASEREITIPGVQPDKLEN
jgi:hypothetical protein